ncbi:MAG TPA: HAD-IIIA family hydrolase, partial [bacterium]|nr:HAD-IIIA family hydrolase [bacterium]
MANSAVFFDRDDTLIRDVPYNGDPHRVELLPGAGAALQRLLDAGFLLIVVSNQSGVGRGLITPDQVEAVNREMIRQLGKPFFTAIYSCFAAPGEDDGNCRKPNPGMLLQASADHDLDLSDSFMIGDKLSDLLCARNAGCRPVLLINPKDDPENRRAAAAVADHAATSLVEAAEWIVHEHNTRIQSLRQKFKSKKECIMISKNQIYRCGVCGNMVEVIAVGGGTLVCCGQKMNLQEENTSDGA